MSLRTRIAVPLVLAASLAAVPAVNLAAPVGGGLVEADDFTGTAGPLASGQIEVATLSTRAATVTGGDVLVGVRGVAADDVVTVFADGVDMSDRFTTEADPFGVDSLHAVGYVDGLPLGTSDIVAVVDGTTHGTRTATLPVTNHPITGPVFSGPHQQPFACQLHRMSDFDPDGTARPTPVGDPSDCHFETYERWYYLSMEAPTELPIDLSDPDFPDGVPYDTWNWVELTDPYGDYPSDVAWSRTTDGDVVPAIARVQTVAINRGMTRIATLDDPAARGAEATFEMPDAYNGRFIYNWGASCGVGREQGDNTPNEVLSGFVDAGGEAIDVGPELVRPAVLQGYVVAHSSMTIFGNHCNQVLSAETFMMIREWVREHLTDFEWIAGNGASGGAIQQYTTMNTYPGLLDGGMPLVSFPDVITTAMSPVDCRLLRQAFAIDDDPNPKLADEREVWTGTRWTIAKQNAITGHVGPNVCEDWDDQFADLVVADKDCGRIPGERYSRETGTGERCTLQDNLRHYFGTDADGVAPIPVDNVGIQYGLQALLDGVITTRDFLDLNRHVGGLSADGYGPWHTEDGEVIRIIGMDDRVEPRMSMSDELARTLYEYGFVTGRGALDQGPVIDVDLYVDPVPILGFHDQVRSYMAAERVEEATGDHDTIAIWSGPVLTNDAWPVMHEWLDTLEDARVAAGGVSESWRDEVVASAPLQGDDSCVVTTGGYSPVPAAVPGTAGSRDAPCEQVFRVGGSPRIAAGGPLTEDIIKCQLAPLDPADYPGVSFTADQWTVLETIFPDGVCDWSKPGVGEVEHSLTWMSWGNDTFVPAEPQAIPNLVARS